MYKQVKRRLVTRYTITTSIIFVLALLSLYAYTMTNIRYRYQTQFDSVVASVQYQIEHSNMVNTSFLQKIEVDHGIVFDLEESGDSIEYRGAYASVESRERLIDSLKHKLIASGVSLTRIPMFCSNNQSETYTIRGAGKEAYWGKSVMIPKEQTYLVVYALFSLDHLYNSYLRSGVLFVLIGILGIGMIYIISSLFLKKTLQPIKENNQKQKEFIACASHELRSPLAYIRTANSTLTKKCLPYVEEQHRDYLKNFIHNTSEECSRMSSLIEDMLLLASAENQSWSIQKEETDLDLFFIESFDKLLPVCEGRQHRLMIHLPDESMGVMRLDSRRVFQVIQSLVNNGLQYTPEESFIELFAEKRKKELRITVVDHGQGIPDSEKPKIFERYYRVEAARADRNHFGLGLSVAKELVSLMDGEIWLEDTKGGGCTFIITFKCQPG